MEIYTTFVAVTRTGAASLGAGSPWTTLAATGANHALWRSPVLAAGGPDARRVAFRQATALMTQSLPMAELLPTVNDTRKQKNVHTTRINAGGYGAMGPHPEREQPV